MAINPLLRPLGITSGILAFCQGLTWSVLTLLGILIYSTAWTPQFDNNSIAYYLYALLLTDTDMDTDTNTDTDTDTLTSRIMKGDVMIAFIGVYFGLSLIWMVLSLCKLWVVIRRKWEYGKGTLITWSVLTGVISILDIVSMSLFASDFNVVIHEYYLYEEDPPISYAVVSAIGIMMTISARGFVLLIANVVFAIMFGLWGSRIEEKDYSNGSSEEIINAYDQRPAWLANGNGFGRPYSNQSFESENQQKQNSLNRNLYTLPPQSDNLGSKMGRNNNSRSHQNDSSQEKGPYIPVPDYSPPSLQKHPKSVLKSRNRY